MNSTNGENIFNVSVNGINGIIEMPAGNYVGSTLASALEQRINQISDPETEPIGGVTVRYWQKKIISYLRQEPLTLQLSR